MFVLIPAVALLVSCSNSNGRQTFDESETDSGTEQLDDNGEQDDYSGDPCDPNPCPGIKHSTGRCTPEEKGRFRSRFGDKFSLWSSSEVENVEEADVAWYVNFYNASINYASVSKADSQVFTRCVREKTE